MAADRILRRIGVLGGMGPEATILFMARIVARTPAQDDQDHVPLIVDCNTQVPSRLRALFDGDGPDPGPTLADMARGLETAGAQALALPCNTAHYYAPVIQAAVSIPLVNMIEHSVDAVVARHPNVRRVGLLASPAVQRVGLFERTFARIDAEILYPKDQESLLAAINAVKSGNDLDGARQALSTAAKNLTGQGAEVLLIGCSELSVISDAIGDDDRVIDTIDVLVDEVVSFSTRQSTDGRAQTGSVHPVFNEAPEVEKNRHTNCSV